MLPLSFTLLWHARFVNTRSSAASVTDDRNHPRTTTIVRFRTTTPRDTRRPRNPRASSNTFDAIFNIPPGFLRRVRFPITFRAQNKPPATRVKVSTSGKVRKIA
uniref:Putative secreted protein n=1 Tax=Anopheles darlingi TaxID=43151 RepID=A0A2M4D8X2_ANODA